MEIESLGFEVLPDYDKCFGCGKSNPIGLKLRFKNEEGTARCEFIPGPEHQGWPGVVHGGILSTVLDEALGWAALFHGKKTVTGKLEIRFRKPAKIKEPLHIESKITRDRGRFLIAEASAKDCEGNVIAEAIGTMFVIP
ncbi:MAG: PaaI family thioesterase [Anaerolineae bacterium]|nr:PaaI family thioesterase [Anaerolineae bacterium]MDW8102909.1 PaaI family thioesterase [Anaerolineae bacterium]